VQKKIIISTRILFKNLHSKVFVERTHEVITQAQRKSSFAEPITNTKYGYIIVFIIIIIIIIININIIVIVY